MEITARIRETREALGRTVRLRRRELGMSQEELASRAGLDQAYISHVEAARRNVSIDNLTRLALALELDVAALFGPQG
jgi:transcriptional regulator with XRE-family HTH domain